MTKQLRNKLLSQGLLVLSQVAFPLITYPIVTNALHAEGLGKVNFADSIVQTVLIIASLGIPLYAMREMAIRRQIQEKSQLFRELFILQAALVLPAFALIWIIGISSDVDKALLWTGTIALAASSLSCDWWFQGNESFLFIAIRSLLIRAMAVVLIFFLVKVPGDEVIYYEILTGSVVVTMLVNWLRIFPTLKASESSRPFSHLRFINWIFGCYVLASLFSVLDSLFLGWLSTNEVVGYYSFGYRLIRMASMLIPTLGIVFIPGIAFHFAAGNRKEMTSHISQSQQMIFFFGIPLSLGFLVLAPEIVAVFANQYFHPSVTVLRILSPVPLLAGISHLTGTQLLVSIKKEKVYFLFLLAACMLNILVNLALIPIMQEQGAAIANLATEGFVTVGTVIYLMQSGVMSLPVKKIMVCLVPALMLVPVAFFLRYLGVAPLVTLVGTVLITAVVYLSVQMKFITAIWKKNFFSFNRTSDS